MQSNEFDVDAYLAAMAIPDPPVQTHYRPLHVVGGSDLERYGQGALSKACAKLAATAKGSRNDTLNISAFAMGTLVGAGAIDEHTVVRELEVAARACGLTDSEIPGTIKSGVSKGMLQPRQIQPRKGSRCPHGATAPATPVSMEKIALSDKWDSIISTFKRRNKDGYAPLPTGFAEFDSLVGGLPRGEPTMLAGPPGVGKTSFGIQIWSNIALRGGYTAIYWTLELSIEDIVARATSQMHRLVWEDVIRGNRNEYIYDMRPRLAQPNIVVLDRSTCPSLETFESVIQTCQQTLKLPTFAVVDYLQNIPFDGDHQKVAVEKNMDMIRSCCQAYDTPALVISSCSRANYNLLKPDGSPDFDKALMAAKESGSLEYHTSMLIALAPHKTESDAPADTVYGKLIVAKNRRGCTGWSGYSFHGASGKYEDVPATLLPDQQVALFAQTVMKFMRSRHLSGDKYIRSQDIEDALKCRFSKAQSALAYLNDTERVAHHKGKGWFICGHDVAKFPSSNPI